MSDRKIRQGIQLNISNEMKKVTPILDQEEDEAPLTAKQLYDLKVSVKKFEQYQIRLQGLNATIIEACESAEAMNKEVADSMALEESVLDTLIRAQTLIEKNESESHQAAQVTHSPPLPNPSGTVVGGEALASTIRLPKFEMTKFSGDPMSWQSFWDVYKAAIHDNKKLSDVEKFSYLLGYLSGDAKSLAKGYQLTASNYGEVVKALQERFGDKQRATFAHFEAMLAIPNASHDVAELQRVSDKCEVHIRSLNALGLEEDTFGVVFAPIILSKLPTYVKTELYRKNGKQKWTLSNVREWLKEEIRARDLGRTSDGAGSGKDKKSGQNGRKGPNMSGSQLLQHDKSKKSPPSKRCAFCKESHYSDQCEKYKDIASRKSALDDRACYICLQTGHSRANCRASKRACVHCQKSGHHRSLCLSKFGGDSTPKNGLNPNAGGFTPNPNASQTVAISQGDHVSGFDNPLLPTAVAPIQNETGRQKLVGRLLLDTASSRSFITDALCKKLRLQNLGSSFMSTASFGTNKRSTTVCKRVKFGVVCKDGSVLTIVANVTPIISCPISRQPLDAKRYPIVNQIQLADPQSEHPDELPLDILIGTDNYYRFVEPSNVLKAGDHGPVFIQSKLGFLTAGVVASDKSSDDNTLVLLLTESVPGSRDHSDCYNVERFWKLEDVACKKEELSDEQALQDFQSKVSFQNGRYHVAWPWKTEKPELHDNYEVALSRLKSTYARLKQAPNLLGTYDEIIKGQLEKGIVEPVPEVPNGIVYYVPHHCVITPQKTTTKIRIVYDASAKARKHAASLNDCLHRGPVILEDLCGLLLRFRLHRVALTSDIEKAFLQVSLYPSQRDVGRFLWVKDIGKCLSPNNLVQYRFTRVFFGAISSPFLLAATVDHHLRQSSSETAKSIRENIYVDNVITGETSEDETIHHYHQAKQLFREANMNLREFFTNSKRVREAIKADDRGSEESTKILGVIWNTGTDQITCPGLKSVSTCKTVTKRCVVRHVAQIFDPCGWFAPVVVTGKLLIQELWESKVNWDELVSAEVQGRWTKVRTELEQIPKYAINRFVGSVATSEVELHAFCDASGKVSATCVYLRLRRGADINCHLMLGRTRLGPISPKQSIPRLELIAVEVGTAAIQFVENQLKIKAKKFVWTDSQCVLHWLLKDKLSMRFVKNRVERIRSAKDIEFRYVPTAENPADIPSRGCTYDYLSTCSKWWHGPTWLTKGIQEWPKDFLPSVAEDAGPSHEDLGVTDEPSTTLVVSGGSSAGPMLLNIADFSSLTRLLRVTAYVTRFINNVKGSRENRRNGALGVKEMTAAREFWEKSVQQESLKDWFPKNSPQYKIKQASRLDIFEDDRGILRCASRVEQSVLPYEARNPVLLPKEHPYTRLVIKNAHEACRHAGVGQTLVEVRRTHWVIQGRNQVKSVISNCRKCRRIEGGPYDVPKSPVLPKFRLDENHPPFTYTGVDYLGPILAKLPSGEKKKVWIALFTCAVTRGVHLEVVESQSSEDFHLALRRFIANRGSPKLVVSDNASQFHAVSQAMSKMNPSVEDLAADHLIEWLFLPQVSPWMGGFYERLVGLVKRFLKKCLDGLCATMPELNTIVCEVADTVNSRPLLYVEDDVQPFQLRPSDFLGKAEKRSIPPLHVSDRGIPSSTPGRVISQWKRVQAASENYWNLWRQGYLTALREKDTKMKQRNASHLQPTIGSVVQVKDKVPRGQWKLGKIEKLNKSKDDKIRSVELKLSSGYTITRPVKLLYPLEMQEDEKPPETADTATANDSSPDDDEDGFQGFDSEDVESTKKVLAAYTKMIDAQNKNVDNVSALATATPRKGSGLYQTAKSLGLDNQVASARKCPEKRLAVAKFSPFVSINIGKKWLAPLQIHILLACPIQLCFRTLVCTLCLILLVLNSVNSQIMTNIVHIVYGHPLGPAMTHRSGLRFGNRPERPTSLDQAFEAILMIQHQKFAEAEQVLNNEIIKWQPGKLGQFRNEILKPEELNVKFTMCAPRIYEALMFHQLRDPKNPFRLSLEDAKNQYGQFMEFRYYLDNKALGSGCKYKKWQDPPLGYSSYTASLERCLSALQNGYIPDHYDREIEALLSNPYLFEPKWEKSVLIVSDSQCRLLDGVTGGEVVPVSGGKYRDMINVFDSHRLSIQKYPFVICFPGSNIETSHKYPFEARKREFNDLAGILEELASERAPGAVMFSSGVGRDSPEVLNHIRYMADTFSRTQVAFLDWNEFDYPFLDQTGRLQVSFFDIKHGFGHLNKRGTQALWQYWAQKMPILQRLSYNLLGQPSSVPKTVFASSDNHVSYYNSVKDLFITVDLSDPFLGLIRTPESTAKSYKLSVTSNGRGRQIMYRENTRVLMEDDSEPQHHVIRSSGQRSCSRSSDPDIDDNTRQGVVTQSAGQRSPYRGSDLTDDSDDNTRQGVVTQSAGQRSPYRGSDLTDDSDDNTRQGVVTQSAGQRSPYRGSDPADDSDDNTRQGVVTHSDGQRSPYRGSDQEEDNGDNSRQGVVNQSRGQRSPYRGSDLASDIDEVQPQRQVIHRGAPAQRSQGQRVGIRHGHRPRSLDRPKSRGKKRKHSRKNDSPQGYHHERPCHA